MFHIHALEKYLNVYNKNQQMHMYDIFSHILLITNMFFHHFYDHYHGSITKVLRMQYVNCTDVSTPVWP
jgi:hypothetical protein